MKLLLLTADIDGNGSGLNLFFSHDQDIGIAKDLILFDLLIHVFIRVVGLHADAVTDQELLDLPGIGIMLLKDRHDPRDTHDLRHEPEP